MTGDFAIAFLRVAPHASEPARMQRNLEAMQKQKLMTLSEFRGGPRTALKPRGVPGSRERPDGVQEQLSGGDAVRV